MPYSEWTDKDGTEYIAAPEVRGCRGCDISDNGVPGAKCAETRRKGVRPECTGRTTSLDEARSHAVIWKVKTPQDPVLTVRVQLPGNGKAPLVIPIPKGGPMREEDMHITIPRPETPKAPSVDPGPGYRLLEDGEEVPEGAEGYVPSIGERPEYWFKVPKHLIGSCWGVGVLALCRIKLPEPPAPRALEEEILEHLDAQDAKPSEDSADALRFAFFQQGAPGAQGWSVLTEVSTDLPKHDGHYRTLEAKGAEPIERMEALVCRGIPEDLHRIAKRNLNMAMASKHQDRAGEKSGEAWEKELQKAENYLHRAWSGRWIG